MPTLIRAALVVGVCLPSAALAQVAPSFSQLFVETQGSPRVAEGEAEVDRARGLAQQSRARLNPTVSLTSENILGTTPYTRFDRAETTLQYSQPFELGGKRSARIAVGDAGVSAAQARLRGIRIDYAFDLATAYAGVEIAERRVTLAEFEVREAMAVLDLTQILVGEGREAQVRALQAESALGAVRSERESARAARVVAYSRLSALVGSPIMFTSISESLLDRTESLDGFAILDAASSPGYQFAEAEVLVARRRVESERRRRTPDVTGTLGVRRLDGENATAVIAGVSVPLPLFDRNRGNISAAESDLRAAEARLAGVRNDLEGASRSARAEIDAANARVRAAKETLDTVMGTYRLVRVAYESGKSPLAEVLIARRALGTARAELLGAVVARFELIAQLARLQGRTVTGEIIQ